MSELTITELENIMSEDYEFKNSDACKILKGLNIIKKYLPNSGLEASGHDEIWACDVEELVKSGITKEDAILLRGLDWRIDEDSLSHFV